MAQELGEPFITSWVFNEASLQMQPNGAGHGQWPWMLKTPDITLYISQGKWNGVGAVRLSSQYLWSCTSLRDALNLLNTFLEDVFGQGMHLQPSEVHLCADIAGWSDIDTLDRCHSAATMLLAMGVHPKVVQELLGHNQISMTMDIYSHVLPTMQKEAMDKMNDAFQG